MRRCSFLVVQIGVEERDRFQEVAAVVVHGEVDGVEILLATEAPGQIALGVGRGMEVVAEGTEKPEAGLGDLPGDAEDVRDEGSDGDVVAEAT